MTFQLKQDLNDGNILLLHHPNDTERLTVAENRQYRWLTLGDTVQTVIEHQAPDKLLLPHLHAILLGPLFQPAMQEIVILGLGGGQLSQILSQQYHVVSIDNNPDVIDAYHRFFIREPMGQHQIIEQDAPQYLQQRKDPIDWLIIDLCSENGSPDFLWQPDFQQLCIQRLAETGLLCINLIEHWQLKLMHLKDQLEEKFGQPAQVFSIPGYRNKILFFSQCKIPRLQWSEKLLEYCSHWQIDLNQIKYATGI